MPKRFKETVDLQPQEVRTGAASGTLSLAQRLEEFQSTSRQVTSGLISKVGKQAEERGGLSGEAVPIKRTAGKTQVPEFREKKFIGSVEINAHNKALRASYIAALGNDIREGIGDIQNKNPDNLVKFNDLSEGFAKGMVESVDPSVRHLVEGALDNRITTGRVTVQAANIKKDSAIAKASLQKSMDSAGLEAARAAFEGDTLTSAENLAQVKIILGEMKDANYISSDQEAEFFRNYEMEATEQTKRRELDILSDKSIEDATALVDRWENKIPKGWSPDEWKTFIKSARVDLNHKKQVQKAGTLESSNIEERKLFDSLLTGDLNPTQIKNAKLNTEDKRQKWFDRYLSNKRSARAAVIAEETLQRTRRNDLHVQEQRVKIKIETEEEQILDDIYSEGKLTTSVLNASKAKSSIKRQYRSLMENRAKVAKDDAKKLKKNLAENEIELNLGNWEDGELDIYLDRGLTADEVFQWEQRNNDVKNDPNNYKNDIVYKAGLIDLKNAKKNLLYIGGEETDDLAEDNKNTQRYLQAIEQYNSMASQPDADFAEILDSIKKPYIEDATKGLLDAWFFKMLTPPGVFEAATKIKKILSGKENDLSGKSDEEILKMLGE
jgi:hypothetical protein